MTTRYNNLDAIAQFLRNAADTRHKTEETINRLPFNQRMAVIKQETIKGNLKDAYTVKELSESLPLSYHNIRYALVGAHDADHRAQRQPMPLAQIGIRVEYKTKRMPVYRFDAELLYQTLVNSGPKNLSAEEADALLNSQPEPVVKPDKNEATPAPVSVECGLIHVQGWLRDAIKGALNVSDMSTDENNIVMVNGSPLVGVFYASADWAVANGYSVDDATLIPYNTDSVKREELQE